VHSELKELHRRRQEDHDFDQQIANLGNDVDESVGHMDQAFQNIDRAFNKMFPGSRMSKRKS
jgi:hypothetical protein